MCLPVEYPNGRARSFRWSFICPNDTVFSQELFTCVRMEDLAIDCKESERYYELNSNFGGMMSGSEDVNEPLPPADEVRRDEEKINIQQETSNTLMNQKQSLSAYRKPENEINNEFVPEDSLSGINQFIDHKENPELSELILPETNEGQKFISELVEDDQSQYEYVPLEVHDQQQSHLESQRYSLEKLESPEINPESLSINKNELISTESPTAGKVVEENEFNHETQNEHTEYQDSETQYTEEAQPNEETQPIEESHPLEEMQPNENIPEVAEKLVDNAEPATISNLFPTYFIQETIDENEPAIFLPLKLNVGQPPELQQQKEVPIDKLVVDTNAGILEKIEEVLENNLANEQVVSQTESDSERRLKRRHIKRRNNVQRKPFLFKADASH